MSHGVPFRYLRTKQDVTSLRRFAFVLLFLSAVTATAAIGSTTAFVVVSPVGSSSVAASRSSALASVSTEVGSSSTTTTNEDKVASSGKDLDVERVLDEIQQVHDAEVQSSRVGYDATFANENENENALWTDSDFTSRSVGVGNAGPDEFRLKHGDKVFSTVRPVFDRSECEELVREARAVIDAGLQDEDDALSNSKLGEARVSSLSPAVTERLHRRMRDTLFPLIESRYGVPAEDLVLANDGLILGYGYLNNGAGSKAQPVHRDASLLSLNVALSPTTDYEGGGTYFEGIPSPSNTTTYQSLEQGHVLTHSSGAMHAGNGLVTGERWVLVLFCLATSIPQHARRCHDRGVRSRADGDLDTAEACFRAGLHRAPNDHLLHLSLGGIHQARGDEERSLQRLERADALYPLDHRSLMSLGHAAMQTNPYRAFVRFDTVVRRIEDRASKDDAWLPLKAAAYDAGLYAARCAVVCADHEMSNKGGGDHHFSRTQLPVAVERMRGLQRVAPQDPRIGGMLAKALELLEKL